LACAHALITTAAGVLMLIVLPIPFFYRAGISAAFVCFCFQAIANFISSELKAEGRFPREALWQITVRTVSALGILIVLFFICHDPWVIFAGWASGLLLSLWLSPLPVPLTLPAVVASFGYRGIWRACLAFMAIDAATAIYYRCDILILKYLSHDAAQVGFYAAAYRFLDAFVLLSAPVGVICFRKLRLIWEDKRAFYSLVFKMALVMVGAAGIVLLLGILFGKEIVFLTFGRNYTETTRILPLLLGSLIFILPNTILTQAAIAQNRELMYAAAAGIGSLFNIGLNFILIPEFGGVGAAWATIATEGLLSVILILNFKFQVLSEKFK